MDVRGEDGGGGVGVPGCGVAGVGEGVQLVVLGSVSVRRRSKGRLEMSEEVAVAANVVRIVCLCG